MVSHSELVLTSGTDMTKDQVQDVKVNEVLLEHPADGVALLTLNRPAVKNALNAEVRALLGSLVQQAADDPSIRVIVITGGACFAAGADLKYLAEQTAQTFLTQAPTASKSWEVLKDCPKPLIAAVESYALGGGCELAMHCDIIVAGQGASFGQPEIRVGIMPGAGGTQRLVRAVGKFRAMKMLLTGESLTADEALIAGLVSEVVPKGEALARSLKMAIHIASMPPLAVKQIKEVVLAGQDVSLDVGLKLERKAFQLLFASDDQKEGMRAFLEKRPAVFSGK